MERRSGGGGIYAQLEKYRHVEKEIDRCKKNGYISGEIGGERYEQKRRKQRDTFFHSVCVCEREREKEEVYERDRQNERLINIEI